MTVAFRRGLLPPLFAILALVVTMHQANAIEHVDATSHAAVHLERLADHEVGHPLHAAGCCTMIFGMVAPDYTTAYSDIEGIPFTLIKDETQAHLQFRSKHFRPPRLA